MEISNKTTIFIVVACLLGILYLTNTPDNTQTGATSVESQTLENNHTDSLKEMEANFASMPETVSKVMTEHEARSKQIGAERAEIEAHRAEIMQKQAEIEAKWGTVEPRVK